MPPHRIAAQGSGVGNGLAPCPRIAAEGSGVGNGLAPCPRIAIASQSHRRAAEGSGAGNSVGPCPMPRIASHRSGGQHGLAPCPRIASQRRAAALEMALAAEFRSRGGGRNPNRHGAFEVNQAPELIKLIKEVVQKQFTLTPGIEIYSGRDLETSCAFSMCLCALYWKIVQFRGFGLAG
eukprot:COSAG02_NODE_4396_length_5408_cov_13.262938_3_plen_179_part_00